MKEKLKADWSKEIDELVDYYVSNKELLARALNTLEGYITYSEKLKPLIQFTKSRFKDPEHLRDKLTRKAEQAIKDKKPFEYTKENLFTKINDLVGFRIIHLYTKQIEKIDKEIKKILKEERWQIVEGPWARIWDEESSRYFKSIGMEINPSPNLNMYTSVHYVVKPNSSSPVTCEIQVRTLIEEVWGEVDHSVNYPHKSESAACRDQIKVLARITSSCSGLVDSIFSTHEEFEMNKKVSLNKPSPVAKKSIQRKN